VVAVISQVFGRLATKELDHVEIMTEGGVGYELSIRPARTRVADGGRDGDAAHDPSVREDGWQLFGFTTPYERRVFRRVLDAKGVGPALALGLLSALSADRLVRAIREKDIATLQSVPRVGRKKAEQMVLDLADKLDGLGGAPVSGPRPEGAGAAAPAAGLVRLHAGGGRESRACGIESNGRAQSATELIPLVAGSRWGRWPPTYTAG
jgi:Holliday junction DNA helicase RuvA